MTEHMTSITRAHVARNVALYAANWAGNSSRHSTYIRALRNRALRTHNTCAACGFSLSGRGPVQLCHIVGGGRGG